MLNAIGAAWGVLLLAELFRPRAFETGRRLIGLGLLVTFCALPFAWLLDPPQFVPLPASSVEPRKPMTTVRIPTRL